MNIGKMMVILKICIELLKKLKYEIETGQSDIINKCNMLLLWP